LFDRRVVVTGLGAITPVGNNLEDTWKALVEGRSGISYVTRYDLGDIPVKIGGEVKGFDPASVVDPKEARYMSRATVFAIAAADEAIKQAGLQITPENAERVGIYMGSGAGGIELLLEQQKVLEQKGPRRVSPYLMPNFIVDSASGHMAIRYGAQGPNMAPVSACATGGHSVGEAYETIRRGDADVMIAGGTEGGSHLPIMFAGFSVIKALANDDPPEKACKPFDLNRSGFVLSEGAAVLVLEELEHALSRGAKPLAEIIGYGTGNDAFHMASQPEGGAGAARVMRMAIRKANIAPEEVDYINAHGTGTQINDKGETAAIKEVFGDHAYKLAISSIKSMIGHTMGAAGAIEAVACVKTIIEGCIPPTINYETPDPECDLDYVPNTARSADVRVALSNSLGLGGHNSCLIFRKFE